MEQTVNNFNMLYTIVTLMFACGVSYATIKVSIKSMTDQVRKLESKVEKLESSLTQMQIEKAVNKHVLDRIEKQLSDIDKKLSKVSEYYDSMEKRGAQRWREEKAV